VKNCLETVLEAAGRVDVLINNAGTFALQRISAELWTCFQAIACTA